LWHKNEEHFAFAAGDKTKAGLRLDCVLTPPTLFRATRVCDPHPTGTQRGFHRYARPDGKVSPQRWDSKRMHARQRVPLLVPRSVQRFPNSLLWNRPEFHGPLATLAAEMRSRAHRAANQSRLLAPQQIR